jgi:lipopolysaccharide transport system permease protein
MMSCFTAVGIAGFDELARGMRQWRVWHLLGIWDLRHRYARSKLGQLWMVLSTAIMILALGIVWSLLWNQAIGELMPFIGVGLIIWNFLTQVLTECTAIFVVHGNFYRNQRMNFSVSIYSVVYKNTMILAHSLIIVAILIIVFRVPFNWYQLQIVPSFVLTWITMVWSGYIIAMACVRYRDVIQVITNWLAILFFLTPVMWKADFLPSQYRFIIDYNPFAQFLELLRAPLLGEPVSLHTWVSTLVIAVGGAMIALPLIGRYQRRVIFWM